jgi:hypothetical protein
LLERIGKISMALVYRKNMNLGRFFQMTKQDMGGCFELERKEIYSKTKETKGSVYLSRKQT